MDINYDIFVSMLGNPWQQATTLFNDKGYLKSEGGGLR